MNRYEELKEAIGMYGKAGHLPEVTDAVDARAERLEARLAAIAAERLLLRLERKQCRRELANIRAVRALQVDWHLERGRHA